MIADSRKLNGFEQFDILRLEDFSNKCAVKNEPLRISVISRVIQQRN